MREPGYGGFDNFANLAIFVVLATQREGLTYGTARVTASGRDASKPSGI
jgi:hypothetical protein